MMINVLSQNEYFLGLRKVCNLTKHITFNLISDSKIHIVLYRIIDIFLVEIL